jgi:hypothetical protein
MIEKDKIVDGIVFLSLGLAPAIILLIYPNYSSMLPRLDENLFEQLAQVNATIIRFTLVGIFYYLGKVDDVKYKFLNEYQAIVEYLAEYASLTNDYSEILFRVLDKSKNPLANHYVELLRHHKQKNLSDKDNVYYSIEKMSAVFNDINKAIRRTATYIAMVFGVAISFCFWGMILFSSGNDKHAWNILIPTITIMLTSIYYFHRFWNDVQYSTEFLEAQGLAFTIFKMKTAEENKERDKK